MMLRVKGLKAAYCGSLALHGVDLEIEAGEVVCLIGRNGMGKTSTIRAVAQDLITISEGEVEFEGRSLINMPANHVNRLGVAYVPRDRWVFASLTVAENLRVPNPPLREGAAKWTLEGVYELFPQLRAYRSRVAGVMSGGEQQMLSIAITAHKPKAAPPG